ncbi:hypothetical protein FN846DRAFT_909608 [Sphaerosporella brunnea]|uniref:Uncharacterized protein n=1 Tax=Sphaerosporella brunnea TaxID=1250544 RepID=A0A5J5EQM9_9PEZI|nr:hypothetical protein FN846DRAFT_909608 [Sphaerosporella brunnea]
MDQPMWQPETYRAQERAFPNVLASPREISLPPLKLVVPQDALKHVVAKRLEIDLEVVLNMYGDCVDEAGWSVMAFLWPYYVEKFTVIGGPLFSESLLTIQFKGKLAIKLPVPQPDHLTVGCLRRIVVTYMRQLGTAATSYKDYSFNRASQACPKTPTLLARIGVPSADVDNEKPRDCAVCTFIAVHAQWIKFPNKREPTQDILMASATPISQVKSFAEKRFLGALPVDHDAWKDKIIVQHDVVVRFDDGHWTEVPDPDRTTLGSLHSPVQLVIGDCDYCQTG